jgi:hypothetical protein
VIVPSLYRNIRKAEIVIRFRFLDNDSVTIGNSVVSGKHVTTRLLYAGHSKSSANVIGSAAPEGDEADKLVCLLAGGPLYTAAEFYEISIPS